MTRQEVFKHRSAVCLMVYKSKSAENTDEENFPGRTSKHEFVMDHHVLVRMQIRQICTTRRVQNVRLIHYSAIRTRLSVSGQFVNERLRRASFRPDREKDPVAMHYGKCRT